MQASDAYARYHIDYLRSRYADDPITSAYLMSLDMEYVSLWEKTMAELYHQRLSRFGVLSQGFWPVLAGTPLEDRLNEILASDIHTEVELQLKQLWLDITEDVPWIKQRIAETTKRIHPYVIALLTLEDLDELDEDTYTVAPADAEAAVRRLAAALDIELDAELAAAPDAEPAPPTSTHYVDNDWHIASWRPPAPQQECPEVAVEETVEETVEEPVASGPYYIISSVIRYVDMRLTPSYLDLPCTSIVLGEYRTLSAAVAEAKVYSTDPIERTCLGIVAVVTTLSDGTVVLCDW